VSVHTFENEYDCAIGLGEREERLMPQRLRMYYRPTDPQIAWHLARFIENGRSLPAGPGHRPPELAFGLRLHLTDKGAGSESFSFGCDRTF